MAAVGTEESGEGRSLEYISSEQQLCQSGEALVEWRSSEQIESDTPSTSPPYWDSSDDDDDDGGPKPSELYGKYTWKIDKFSQINKRELRSNAFDVGGYKWYILIYPQGCDVCNHLSLFLCVANHDKLLPGWSHFAQFTIAVVNKDPKKSKYSDTLHRFWKKEHDWGWKKFMELSKVMDGFIDADTLIIKAQVQVIRERANRPFRCLDCQYRRELVRVYLTNVEQIFRRFVEERRGKLEKLIEDKSRWFSICGFWLGIDQSSRCRMSRENTDLILKTIVKHFFIEKEVTSTLVMDSLYSGLKALEDHTKGKKSKLKNLETEEFPVPVIRIEKETLVLEDDVLPLLKRVAMEPLPPKDEKGPQNRTKDGATGEEFIKDSIERDERRLTELGRRTIEIFVLAHIFSNIEVAYQEAVSLKRQEELIREEEEAWLADVEQKMKRGAFNKEKKSKKKQRRNSRKGKDKNRDEKPDINALVKMEQAILDAGRKDFVNSDKDRVLGKHDAVEDIYDVSDSPDCFSELLPPELKDGDARPVNRSADALDFHPSTEAGGSDINGLSCMLSELEGISLSFVDDNSSTCATEMIPSEATSVINDGNARDNKAHKYSSSGRNHHRKVTSDKVELINEERSQPSDTRPDTEHSNVAVRTSKTSDSIYRPSLNSTQEELYNNQSGKNGVSVESSGDQMESVSSPKILSTDISSVSLHILESKIEVTRDCSAVKTMSSDSPKNFGISACNTNLAELSAISNCEAQNFPAPKHSENSSTHQVPIVSEKASQQVQITSEKSSTPSTQQQSVVSRPLSAPLFPAKRPAVSSVSVVQTAPALVRSVSATSRLGPEASASTQSYLPQSYRSAIISSHFTGNSLSYIQNPSTSSVNASQSYSQAALVSTPLILWQSSDRLESNPVRPSFSFGMVNRHDMLQNRPIWMGGHQKENNRKLSVDNAPVLNDVKRYELYETEHSRSQDHLSSEFPACTSGRQSHILVDEFPHLDIINDLLEDEHGIGVETEKTSSYPSFSDMPQNLNRQFTFPGYPGMSNGLSRSSSSSLSERTHSYLDNGLQHGYSGNPYDSVRDIIPQTCPQLYVNGQIDSLMNQWQIARPDMPYPHIRSADNNGYSYHIPEFPNQNIGVNGYSVFRPSSNGL